MQEFNTDDDQAGYTYGLDEARQQLRQNKKHLGVRPSSAAGVSSVDTSGARSTGVAALIIAAIALILGITALVLALWKWYYWAPIPGGGGIFSSHNVRVDGWLNVLNFYLIAGYYGIRLEVIPLLPAPDTAIIYGTVSITTTLQEADKYHLWRVTDPTTQPNTLFIDNYVQQVDSVDGTIGLNFVTMNGYFFISDETYKKNISTINGTDALVVVRAINASSFIWVDDSQERLQFGFLAQGVNDTLPEAVSSFGGTGGSNGTLGIGMVPLLAQLWAAVQELDKTVNP
jgi:hypothetical protein